MLNFLFTKLFLHLKSTPKQLTDDFLPRYKKLFSIIALLFILQPGYSQRITFRNLTRRSSSDSIYYLYYNKVLLLSEASRLKDWVLKSDNISIIKESDSMYYFKYDNNDSLPPSFKIKSKKTGELVKNYVLNIDYKIPLPVPVINYRQRESGAEVLPEKLTTLLLAPAFEDNYNRKVFFEIVSFKAAIIHNGKLVYSHFNKGNKFDEKINSYYFKCIPGDKIVISKVTLKAPNGKLYAGSDRNISMN